MNMKSISFVVVSVSFVPFIHCNVIRDVRTGIVSFNSTGSSSSSSLPSTITESFVSFETLQTETSSSTFTLSVKPVEGVVEVKPSLVADPSPSTLVGLQTVEVKSTLAPSSLPTISDGNFNINNPSETATTTLSLDLLESIEITSTLAPSSTLTISDQNLNISSPSATTTLPPARIEDILATATIGQVVQPSGFPNPITLQATNFELLSLILEASTASEVFVTKQSAEVKASLSPDESISCCDGPIFRTLTGDELPKASGGFRVVGGDTGEGVEVTTTESFKLFTPTTTVVAGLEPTRAIEKSISTGGGPDIIDIKTEIESDVSETTERQQPTEPVFIVPIQTTAPPSQQTTAEPQNPVSSEKGFESDERPLPTQTDVAEAPKTVVVTQRITVIDRPAITVIQGPSNSVVLIGDVTFTLGGEKSTLLISGKKTTLPVQTPSPIQNPVRKGGENTRASSTAEKTRIVVITDATATKTLRISDPSPTRIDTESLQPTASGTDPKSKARQDPVPTGSPEAVVIEGQTLTAGGVITVDSQTLSLASGGSGIVVGGSRTIGFQTMASVSASSRAVEASSSVTEGVKNPTPTSGEVAAGITGGAALPDIEDESVGVRLAQGRGVLLAWSLLFGFLGVWGFV